MAIIYTEKQKFTGHELALSQRISRGLEVSSPPFHVIIPLFIGMMALLSIILCVWRARRSFLRVRDSKKTDKLDYSENTLTAPLSYKLPIPVFQAPGIDLSLPLVAPAETIQLPMTAQVSTLPSVYKNYRISAAEFPSPCGPPPPLPPRSPMRADEKKWRTLEVGKLRSTPWASEISTMPRAHSQRRQTKKEKILAVEEVSDARRARMNMRVAAGYDGYRGN